MNLVLAVVWLAGGVGLMIYETVTGTKRFQILGTGVSVSWFCYVLAVYNLVRWYSARSAKQDEEAQRIVEAARARRSRDRAREEPNPMFDFTNKPPDVPPSNN